MKTTCNNSMGSHVGYAPVKQLDKPRIYIYPYLGYRGTGDYLQILLPPGYVIFRTIVKPNAGLTGAAHFKNRAENKT